MHYRTSRKLMWILYGAGIAVMLLSLLFPGLPGLMCALLLAGAAVMMGGVVQAWIFYRCPECGYALMHLRGGIPGYCPECGDKLR